MPKEKDVSTRLIRPTIANVDAPRLMLFVERWDHNWEVDGSIQIFDEGIAQYMLTDAESHYKYLAALILNKPSLRCSLTSHEPEDILDQSGNTITLENLDGLSREESKNLEYLKSILGGRGFRFSS